MKSSLRLIVVGDEGVGKTTLITSFLKEVYEPSVPKCLPEISIPADITVDKVHTFIIDTQFDEDGGQLLEQQLKTADAICLVHAVDNPDSFERLSEFWLPYIQSNAPLTPIVLVGNKIDLRPESESADVVNQQIIPLMNQYKEIETCIESSAKEILNVAEVFYFASKAVLHPTSPLFDIAEHKLKPPAYDALARVFRLCDLNNDGLLSDLELNAFQRKVFGSPLQQTELEGVKDVVRQGMPDGVRQNALTQEGFIYLHSLFVQRGRLETIWAVLRAFGYDDSVSLREDFLMPDIGATEDDATELSPKGYQFFIELFQKFDKDKDGALNDEELRELFFTAPSLPWADDEYAVVTNNKGAVTFQGFLALWSMTTLIDVKKTLRYLAYLGYDGDRRSAISILKNRRSKSPKKRASRSVFHGLVFGATGSGKTEFLKGLVEKPFTQSYNPNAAPLKVVNSVESRGAEKYLVLEEVDVADAQTILDNKDLLERIDVLCFLYDSSDPNSFSYLMQLRKEHDLDKYPVVFIATKGDLPAAEQQSEKSPDEYIKALGLAPALKVSSKHTENRAESEVYNLILGVAMNPHVAMPIEQSGMKTRSWAILGAVTFGLGAVGVGAYYFLRVYKKHAHAITSVSS